MKERSPKPKRDNLSNTRAQFSAEKGRVLIVGHEGPISNIVSSMLTSGGHECRAVGGGQEALALLDAGEKYDVILTDLVNDQLGGIGILERTRERFPEIQIVFMTFARRLGYAFEGVRQGAFDYLLLPVEHEQLLFFVRRAMAHRRLKLQNAEYEKEFGPLATSKNQKPARILIQDDEEPIREIVSSMLTSSGRITTRSGRCPQFKRAI